MSPEQQMTVYQLYSLNIPFSAETYRRAMGLLPPHPGYDNQALAIERMSEAIDEYLPGGFDPVAFDCLCLTAKAHILSVAFISTLTGVYHYPPRVDGTPSGHTQTSEARH